ncbi:hypothetical protein [Lentisalinibacter salinarum]|uniref:hypothetical protein n=1 Tax=Lentisalinibacter salinarum TaxID=2992239 RepID=UPI003866C2F3
MSRRGPFGPVPGAALALMLAAAGVAAAPFDYMRKNEPNALYCMASVGDNCPLDDAAVQALIDDVTRRFSLTRLGTSSDHEPLFYVELYCHRREGSETAYSVETGFAEWVGDDRQHLMKYAYYPYRSVGYGGAVDISETLRRRIEDALEDYLAANFPAAGETQ